jgi:hypothetical protein
MWTAFYRSGNQTWFEDSPDTTTIADIVIGRFRGEDGLAATYDAAEGITVTVQNA